MIHNATNSEPKRMSSHRSAAFNGKFLSVSMTGVHRVAEALLTEIDKQKADHPLLNESILICPKNSHRQLDTTSFRYKKAGVFQGTFWEQLELPRLSKGRLLVSFCNLSPVISRNGITMIHDAQIFTAPDSYSGLFRKWYEFALPRLGKRQDRILTVSEYSKKQLVEFGVAKAEKITVVHNGVDHILAATADNRALKKNGLSDRPYVCALSNAQAHKNIGLLFQVMALDSMRDLTLVLIGGTKRDAFTPATIPDNVVFAGRVTDGEMRGLIEGAVCYLFPSLTEGFGLPPLESMRLGTPAIVAPNGALPEVCGDGAIYADASSPEAWASEISALRTDLDHLDQMKRAGVEQAKQFTWKRAAEKVIGVINDVCS